MRIALLGYRSNPYSGGQGVYLKYLSKALVELGHQVDVISGEPYPHLDPKVGLVKLPGLNLFESPNHVTALRWKHLGSFTDTFEWWSMLTGGFPEPYTFGRRLKAWLNQHPNRYDVIHDNQSLCSALLDIQRGSIPLLCTIHHPITSDRDIALRHANTRTDRLLIRRWHYFLAMQTRVAQRLKNIATVSERSRQDIASAFGIDAQRIRVVPNGIATDEFYPEPEIAREPNLLITTASADAPLKGTQHLIPAIAKLTSEFQDLRLIFIGKPKPGGDTEALINKHNLAPRIEFRHGIEPAEIRSLYARATLAVVPSEYEGFGLPAGEAMACAVPVVSTDGGALPEVVGDAALVVRAGSSETLYEGIRTLLNNPDQRELLGQQGYERVHAKFHWQQTAGHFVQLYQELASQQTNQQPEAEAS